MKKNFNSKASLTFVLIILIFGINKSIAQSSIMVSPAGLSAAEKIKMGVTYVYNENAVKTNNVTSEVKQVIAVPVKTDSYIKQDQAARLKVDCPNYPTATNAGAGITDITAFENWKKAYPAEYTAYLKIFNFKP